MQARYALDTTLDFSFFSWVDRLGAEQATEDLVEC